jgi:hypothetical protein
MTTVRDIQGQLVPFSSIMRGVLIDRHAQGFHPIDSRGIFTDGFLFPILHGQTAAKLQHDLKKHELDVKFPASCSKPNFKWIMLKDGDYILEYVMKNLN